MKQTMGRIAWALLGLVFGAAGQARADLSFTVDDPKHSLKASADISFVADGQGKPIGIEISVTNTSSIHDAAHAVSALLFTINPATVGVPTALTEISGNKITYTKGQGNDYTSTTMGFKDYKPATSDPDLHWYLNHGGASDFRLDNVRYSHIK